MPAPPWLVVDIPPLKGMEYETVLPPGVLPEVTVKALNGTDIPAGVVTVSVLAPVAAPDEIVIEIGKLVDVAPLLIVAVTPLPLNDTAVAPVRLVPAIVADIVEPWFPESDEMEVRAGAGVIGGVVRLLKRIITLVNSKSS